MTTQQEKHYAASELAGLPGMPTTERRVRARATKKGWPSRPRAGRGGGREYPLSALPPETRAHLAGRPSTFVRFLARVLRPVILEALNGEQE